jgi:hypothetical protein
MIRASAFILLLYRLCCFATLFFVGASVVAPA